MTEGSPKTTKARLLEYLLAAAAMLICVASAYMTLKYLRYESMTVIYMTEIAAVGIGGLYSIVKDRPPLSSTWGLASSAMAGILLAFAVLAGFSIGLFLLPAAVSMLIAAALADRRRNRCSLAGVLSMLFTVFIQAAVVLGMMRHH
jgi:hypothetical protein